MLFGAFSYAKGVEIYGRMGAGAEDEAAAFSWLVVCAGRNDAGRVVREAGLQSEYPPNADDDTKHLFQRAVWSV